jgi:hypothetical protein
MSQWQSIQFALKNQAQDRIMKIKELQVPSATEEMNDT